MFVGVARLVLQIPESGSLKAKRQILRRVTDRVKARFNVSVAEVGDNDLWQRAEIALAVVGNDQRHVNEQLEKIIHFVEEMYVAPLASREMEIVPFGDQLYGRKLATRRPPARGMEKKDDEEDEETQIDDLDFSIPKGERSLAEAEGMGDWETRHQSNGGRALHPTVTSGEKSISISGAGKKRPKLSLEEAKAKARKLRNPRDWEKSR
jgi:uncharacterized protein